MYRSCAFLYSRMVTDNAGIFVCKTRHLVLAGGGRVRFVEYFKTKTEIIKMFFYLLALMRFLMSTENLNIKSYN